jgi:hypothetical protein
MIPALYVLLIAIPAFSLSFHFPKYLAGLSSGVYGWGKLRFDRRADPGRFRNVMIFLGAVYVVLAIMLVLGTAQAFTYFSS